MANASSDFGPSVDLSFPVTGELIPADHAYTLFSALCRFGPDLHTTDRLGIHTIQGNQRPNRLLKLSARSRLTVRLPLDNVSSALPWAGAMLPVGDHRIQLGIPAVVRLLPVVRLQSRLVSIKGHSEPEDFLRKAIAMANELGVLADFSLVPVRNLEKPRPEGAGTRSPWIRRTVEIAGKKVVGFALHAEGLTAEESLTLQERGLGGRRHFGCGLFTPVEP